MMTTFHQRTSTSNVFSWQLVDNVEKAAVAAFMQLALKLNEATFRPLFMRLVDWTNPESPETSQSGRQLTFFKVMDRMLVQLKVRSRFSRIALSV